MILTARPTFAASTSPALTSLHKVVLDSPDNSSACLYVPHLWIVSVRKEPLPSLFVVPNHGLYQPDVYRYYQYK